MPTTAGKILNETHLRTYAKCSKRYEYGEMDQEPLEVQVVRRTVEKMIVDSLEEPIEQPERAFVRPLALIMGRLRIDKLMLEGERFKFHNSCIKWLTEFFKVFPPNRYYPVSGPLEYRVKVSKTPVDLHVSAVFRTTQNQTIHVLCFSPYKRGLDLLNDPVVHLKVHLLKPFVKKYGERAQVKMHILGWGEDGAMRYRSIDSEEVDSNYVRRTYNLVKQIELGYFYPVVPCMYQCKWKSTCSPISFEEK